jgi:hypothetical protein
LPRNSTQTGAWVVSVLSVFALLIQGYHPYAEDGGLYVAGIKKRLTPALYPGRPEFVLAHLRFSPFAGAMAAITRLTHLPLEWVLLALYIASVWATLYAGWMVASRATRMASARCGAVTLLACWLTMPIAGTSLLLMDPYVTARSISTPLALAAVAWALDALRGNRRGALLCACALILSLVHPLMSGYALATVLVLAVVGSSRPTVRLWGPWILALCAFAIAGAVQIWAPAESPAYVCVAMTRFYWFPSEWRWYEQFGLLAPLAILFLAGRLNSSDAERWSLLARMAFVLGAISLMIAFCFARPALPTHLVARLQPLRCFQIVYEVMILTIGAGLGKRWRVRWPSGSAALSLGLPVLLGVVMFFVQRGTFPASRHFEWPGRRPRNEWAQAFLWIRANTPTDALFALDTHYITLPGEDAQGFRALSERGALPDYSKDGGEASITPPLADAWAAGQAAQNNLTSEPDNQRSAALWPLGVTWVVLRRAGTTSWTCPYRNATVKVCRVPYPGHIPARGYQRLLGPACPSSGTRCALVDGSAVPPMAPALPGFPGSRERPIDGYSTW